ncbi:MAG: 50S ribosomal protein L18 [Phycisphaerae bacterium]|nr:50S ribosomal protein L18 [Phycisphaerae bacterium]
MDKNKLKSAQRSRRKRGIRRRIFGTPDRPRLTVFRSNRRIYAQVVNDVEGRTLASASSTGLDKGSDTSSAAQVGKTLAEKAKSAGVSAVRFDRNGYLFHGRVKALAEAAREAGLKF